MRFVPGIREVSVEKANDSFRARIDPKHFVWVVVGDKETIFDDLGVLDLEIIELVLL